jgi:hypothetical protein
MLRVRQFVTGVAVALLVLAPGSLVRAQTSVGAAGVGTAMSFFAAPTAPAAAVAYAVIASPTVSVDGLTVEELRNVLLFRKRFWSTGNRVVLLLPASGLDARAYLLTDLYKLSDAGLKRLILEKLFQGEIDVAPRMIESYEQALTLAAATRGALAVVRADAVRPGEVKVLRVNGRLPGEQGYPLSK